MKKAYWIGLSLLLMIGLVAFRPVTKSSEVLDNIKNDYKVNLDDFNNQVDLLLQEAHQYQEEKISKTNLQNRIIITREAYKKVEPFVEYFQIQATTRYINGAPLPKVDESAPEHAVIPPLGLQTLDETIFSDEANAEEIVELAEQLKRHWRDIYLYERSRVLQHRFVFEAMRYQVIRIFTLGLTGFDTPGSVNAIPEAMAALHTMEQSFLHYQKLVPKETKKLAQLISDARTYLEDNNDFDTFDRLHFLRKYINPLYSAIYNLQRNLQVEFVEEADHTVKPVNYHSEHIFDEEFFHKSYFAQVAISDLDDPKKIELGKILFYDPALSRNFKMSCASCHHPDKAFTDGLPKSKSNKPGTTTLRNAPTLVNAVYTDKYFYDLREYDLERQVKHVVQDSKEFNMDFLDLADRLKESEEYMQLFKEAYGDRDKYIISTWSISNALAAYVASLTSFNSPFDQYARGETDEIDESVKRGFNLFMGKGACGTCHFAPTFNGTVPPNYKESESEVLGVPITPDTVDVVIDPDMGRMVNGRVRDKLAHFQYSFKTTTVRNIALTAPYMHNGVYNTLEEVVDFYNRGGGAGMGMDLPHQTLPFDNLQFNQQEMGDLVSFMEALTDTVGMTSVPKILPKFEHHPEWNKRELGGTY